MIIEAGVQRAGRPPSVILRCAQDLSLGRAQILRCAQNDSSASVNAYGGSPSNHFLNGFDITGVK